MTLKDFLFRGEVADVDPDVAELINLEAERQIRRLILIPSEATIPWAVREVLSTQFHNIYAEGYPPEDTRAMSEDEILDVDLRLAEFRRYSDPRYYKGTEFADLIESLARRRGAQLFANERVSADRLFVNVQPLSGVPANSAVYTALIQPGDTIMGMDLLHGGHLSHGSPAARSGRQYHSVFYGIDPKTEQIDYDQAREVALANRPKIIIGGYSSYPLAPDWMRLRKIADECGALLMADVAHVAGLIIAGVFPSPVGIADVVTFTTHKTLGGPRGAVIVTHKADLAKKLDRGVFPGEQGGPHMHAIAALAVAFKLATTPQFKELQIQTARNAARLAKNLASKDLRIVYGGTDTHMLVVDCRSVVGADSTKLSGDMAARMLDLVGITCNRNTIPGDDSAARPSGIRLGTPWITQRGFKDGEIDRLADAIAKVLTSARPFSYDGKGGKADARAKMDYKAYTAIRREVDELCTEAGIDYTLPVVGKKAATKGRNHLVVWDDHDAGPGVIEVRGPEASRFLHTALTSTVYPLKVGDTEATCVLYEDGSLMAAGVLERTAEDTYRLHLKSNDRVTLGVIEWLQALSDGFVVYDETDLYGKVPGPVALRLLSDVTPLPVPSDPMAGYAPNKDYFVGVNGAKYAGPKAPALPAFQWAESASESLKTTPLTALHRDVLKAKMAPFAGYDMPVWYSSVSEEHAAVRNSAGLFDVTHMGVWEVSGPASEGFLNALTTNDISTLAPGEAHYSYLLGTDGTPLDDIYVYRLKPEKFMIVVNASNNDKDWAWANAVRNGQVQIDPDRPGARLLEHPEHVTLRDLRDPSSGADRRVDVALQGPKSRDILLSLHGSDADKAKIKNMAWSTVTRATLGGHDLIVARTGYTGERIAFELFVRPDEAATLFNTLIESGAKPCGLASRDSTRTEAGLPLYGHELGGPLALTPGDAGFASYVKLWKPFFIGKKAYIAREQRRDATVTRFRMDNKGVKPPQNGDPVVDRRGRVIGIVTSCSIDSEGFQTGQAYLKEEFAVEGTPVFVFSGSARAQDGKGPAGLKFGDRTVVPDAATILSKFPAKKKG
jgi:glycine hydroxymethyltransferase